jgi:hypothetical protein
MKPSKQPRGARGRYAPTDTDERMWANIEKEHETVAGINDCWRWIGGMFEETGYGKFYVDRYPHYAHRWVYRRLVGTIPESLELDHLCRHRWCVNPAHLQPVTHRVNVIRGDAAQSNKRRAAERTHCRSGHELTPENTYHNPGGYRACRICLRAGSLRHYWKKKGQNNG